MLRALDERGQSIDALAAESGTSVRTMREHVEVARALESLPEIAAAAHDGLLSDEQLESVVQLADESSDAAWAQRAARMSPVDLARQVRTLEKPTVDDSQRRQEARSLRMWWDDDHAMLNLRGALPDLMGAEFECTVNSLVDQLKPPPGGTWDTRAHRGADALLQLCRNGRRGHDAEAGGNIGPESTGHAPIRAPKPVLVVEVPISGPATIAGIPLADAMVEQLRVNSTIEPVVVDAHGSPLHVGRRRSLLSPKFVRAVLLRDGHCRWPGCDARVGLEIHHLVPRSYGGTDEISNLATVCTVGHHHQQLLPHGPWALVGNPNQPDGLQLLRYDQLTAHEALGHGLPPPPRRRT